MGAAVEHFAVTNPQMITDKFAGDNVGSRIDNLGHDDVTPFPHMSQETVVDQLGGYVAAVESAVPRVTASGLEAPWLSANGFETGVGGSSEDSR